MQRIGAATAEGELEAAIARAGGISEANAGDFGKVQWTRAARTDKGVSAVGQVVALKMVLNRPGLRKGERRFRNDSRCSGSIE